MLKRLIIILSFFLLLSKVTLANEVIRDYKTEITVNMDGSLTYKDIITVEVKHKKINRGLIRDFDLVYEEEAYGKKVPLIYKFHSVNLNGRPEEYSLKYDYRNKLLSVYTGTEKMLNKGLNTFEFNYTIYNQISHFKDEDGIYINITGNEWDMPIVKTTVLVNLPENIKKTAYDAYTGRKGQTLKNFKSGDKANKIAFYTTKALMPFEGFTISVSFEKGVNPEYIYPKIDFIKNPAFYMLVSLGIIFLFYFILWRKHGKDEEPVIVPFYYPPKSLSPPISSELLEIKIDSSKKFTSVILDFARRGLVEIEEKEGNFYVVRTDKTNEEANTPLDEMEVLKYLFPKPGEKIVIGESAYNDRIFDAMEIEEVVEKSLLDEYVKKNVKIAARVRLLNVIFALGGLFFGWFFIPLIYVFSFIIFMLIMGLISVKKNIRPIFYIALAVFGGITISLGIGFTEERGNYSYWHSLIEYILMLGIGVLTMYCHKKFRQAMKKFTENGKKAYSEVSGLKMFMDAVDKERYKKITPEMFETNLPYAVAFNIEDKWCEKFAFDEMGRSNDYALKRVSFVKRMNTGISSTHSHVATMRAPKSNRSSGSGSGSSSSSSRGGGSSGGGSGSRGGRGR